MAFIESNNFNLFTGYPQISNEVKWNSDKENWKEFLLIAKNEGIKTIIYEKGTLEQICINLNEKLDQIPEDENHELITEIKQSIKIYSSMIKEVVYIHLSWIKEGICFSFELFSPVFDKFVEYQEQLEPVLETIIDSNKKADSEEKGRKELIEKRKKLTKLTKEITDWAKTENKKKVTRPIIFGYLLEREIQVSYDDKCLLVNMVNQKLGK
jgi:hypothetical protein